MELSRSYVLITPCKDEAENLPNLLESITAQTIKPKLYVIVDDGSTDGTKQIIDNAINKYEWIKKITLNKSYEYMGPHYAYVCNQGFDYAIEYFEKKDLGWEYIAIVDADNIPEDKYFEKLIHEFEIDEKLGLASGESAYSQINKILLDLKKNDPKTSVMSPQFWELYGSSRMPIQRTYRMDIPMGSARIWRKECFRDTGKYLEVHAPDAISNVKARLRGWKTKRFVNSKVIEREGSSAQGFWKGYLRHGESDFVIGFPLIVAILKTIKYSFKRKPYYAGIAYFCGYIKPLIYRNKKIDDPEIRHYYEFTRTTELKDSIKIALKKITRYL